METNNSLKWLYLDQNMIGDKGIIGLAQALKKNTTLCKLDVSFNLIKEDGMFALSNLLKVNMKLNDLCF